MKNVGSETGKEANCFGMEFRSYKGQEDK